MLVLLAAGASRRLGQPKALAQLQGRSVLEHLLQAARPHTREPLIVAGAHITEISAAAPVGLDVLHNPDWERGRTGGLALAARRRPGADLLVAPVDVPRVPDCVFAALARAWCRAGAPPRGWLAPVLAGPSRLAGSYGHPLVLGASLLQELQERDPSTPLWELRAVAAPLLSVSVSRLEILDDLDTPEDLERLRRP